LIDARLLTSFEEVAVEGNAGHRRVEVVHESLLLSWPRLVGWQTQDADSARLRDELRQAARMWKDHGRARDYLWTGKAFREFSVWRENYPGGLTQLEENFGAAMTSHAKRRKRRRRIAVAAVIAALLAGLAIVGSFWQKSVREARHAEAQKLIAFGQLELEKGPSNAVAHAIASLELSDTPEARLLALEALWKGPTALVVNEDESLPPTFSADGGWLVQSARDPSSLVRIVRADGSTKILERGHKAKRIHHLLSPESDIILTWDNNKNPSPQSIGIWAVPEGRRLAEVRYEGAVILRVLGWEKRRVLLLIVENDRASIDAVSFDGTRERLGTIGNDPRRARSELVNWDHLKCRGLGVVVNNEVLVFDIGQHSLSEPRRLGRQEGSKIRMAFDPLGRYLATASQEGEIRLWDPTGATPPTTLEGPLGIMLFYFTGDGSLLKADFREDGHEKAWIWSVSDGEPRLLRRFDLGDKAPGTWRSIDPVRGQLVRVDWDRKIRLWPFSAPADAEPLIFGRNEIGQLWPAAFDHQGRWLGTSSPSGLTLYPLGRSYPSVIRPGGKKVQKVVFGPDGRWLASCETFEAVRIWPLDGEVPTAGHSLSEDGSVITIAVSPDGEHILAGTRKSKEPGDLLLSLDGSSRRVLTGFRHYTNGVAFSPDGRLAAGVGGWFADDENVIRVWDVASGAELMVLVPEADFVIDSTQFTADNRLLSTGQDGLRRWNIETGQSELLFERPVGDLAASGDGRRALLRTETDDIARAVVLDLHTGVTTSLETHGAHIYAVGLDEAGTIAATGDDDGVIRVGSITGEEPHLLLGHESSVLSIAFDPLGRWLASGGDDGTIRLWPMPDLSKPPLHTLPREELIAKLKTLTNLRVVRDEDSATGWKLTHDPFPGWETVPSW
jgi:WD40 repeat protein